MQEFSELQIPFFKVILCYFGYLKANLKKISILLFVLLIIYKQI